MQVVVNRAPDLFEPTQRTRFREMMAAFEDTEFTMRHNATMIWLDAYEAKLRDDWEHFNISMPTKSVFFYGLKEVKH